MTISGSQEGKAAFLTDGERLVSVQGRISLESCGLNVSLTGLLHACLAS